MTEKHTALVTGATQGIGLAIAQRLASAGHNVVLHGIEDDAAGTVVAQALSRQYSVRSAYVQADLRDMSQAGALWGKAAQALRVPDILVNNAGIQHTCPLESFPDERWQAILAVNLTAAFCTMRAAITDMRSGGWGRIVNIASVHGLVGSVNKGAYVAAKHGLVGLSKGVALETAAQGITVNCICPGWTDTPIIASQIEERAKRFDGNRQASIHDLLREKQPNLTLLPPSRIGDAVVFLASDVAEGITGVALPVDGGWTAQ